MAEKKKMSVEDILAAARKSDSSRGGSGSQSSGAEPPSETPSASPESKGEGAASAVPAGSAAGSGKPAGDKPVKPPAKPAGAAKPGSMSVADILAAARSGGSKAAAPAKEAPAKPAAAKAAPAKAAKAESAEKPAVKPAADKGPSVLDTASILAAARGAAKPGPVSKAELAAREKETPGKDRAEKKKGVVPAMPEKPAYAQARSAAAAGPVVSRRGVVQSVLAGIIAGFSGSSLALGFSSLAVTFNLWTLGFARFMFPNILIEPPTKFKVGFPGELAQGQVQTKYVPQFGVWIVRYEYDGQQQIYALQTVCTHLGCTPNWLEGEQKFKCPCHGSGFYKDGINFEGPAPRPLERFAIRLADDGQLEVDKSRKFKEEVGQWRDPASFVSV